jgi:hypothetical protein
MYTSTISAISGSNRMGDRRTAAKRSTSSLASTNVAAALAASNACHQYQLGTSGMMSPRSLASGGRPVYSANA